MYKLIISKKVELKHWNNNLKKSNYSNFLQTEEYLDSQSNSKNKFPIFLSVEDKSSNIVGQLGVVIQKSPLVYSTKLLKSISKIFSVFGNRISWAGGPIIHSQNNKERIEILKLIIQGLEQISKENNVFMVDGYTNPLDIKIDNEYKQIFQKNGYNKKDFLTYVIELSNSNEDIWNGLSKGAKRDVSKAEKNNISVKELEHKDLEEFYKLAIIWAKTKGIEKSDNSSMMEQYWRHYQKGVEKVFLAYENGELVSSHRIGVFNDIAYSHSLVNSYRKKGSASGPYLTWRGIQWAKENGMKIYDFSGGEAPSNENNNELYEKKWGSLLAYKRKWGGKEVPYFHFVKIQKKKSHKIIRILLRLDWILRNYKRNRFTGRN